MRVGGRSSLKEKITSESKTCWSPFVFHRHLTTNTVMCSTKKIWCSISDQLECIIAGRVGAHVHVCLDHNTTCVHASWKKKKVMLIPCYRCIKVKLKKRLNRTAEKLSTCMDSTYWWALGAGACGKLDQILEETALDHQSGQILGEELLQANSG